MCSREGRAAQRPDLPGLSGLSDKRGQCGPAPALWKGLLRDGVVLIKVFLCPVEKLSASSPWAEQFSHL